MGKIAPFATIEVVWATEHPTCEVLVNGQPVASFTDSASAEAMARELFAQRVAAEGSLEESDPAQYWQQSYGELRNRLGEREEKLQRFNRTMIDAQRQNWKVAQQRRSASSKPRQPRRSPLRQSIVDALRTLRADGQSLHDALRSLTHSPPGALRVRKEGDCWRCENEDEDWPPELLTRQQLNELFKAAL